jgi:hypothetical protein
MQKALRNTSGKPTTVESLDKRDEARHKPSSNHIIEASPKVSDSKASALKAGDKLDRDYEVNRLAQAKAEQSRVSDNPQDAKEFNTRRDG